MRIADQYGPWLEAMYGLRLSPSAQAHRNELGVWVRELEIRASGSRGGAAGAGQ